MRILELFEDPGDPEDTPKLRPAGLPAPKKKGMDENETTQMLHKVPPQV